MATIVTLNVNSPTSPATPNTATSATSTTAAVNVTSPTTTTTTTTMTATTVSMIPETIPHPFSDIIEPFQQAVNDSEERNWCFPKGEISMDKFIMAITGFLNIFDALGSNVITDIVRKDFRWKTNGLRNSSKRLNAESVRDLVRKELKSPPRFWAPSGIESLLWSHRILSFVEQMVDHLVADSTLELREACLRSYRATLALRHPPMTKVIFEKALNLVPPRATFIANLTNRDVPTDDDFKLCFIGMKDFLRSTRPVIEALRTLFDMEEIDDLYR